MGSTNSRKVAIYARVSTEHEAQLSALDNQVQYYDNLLSLHPDWELYDRYIDEGITGTSTKKRKNFMRMMEDANEGCFDLIVTREVSRFARNTVDTLQETRKLKKIGVEVYFTEDNIWTMNDEDGELRLTIMATLAQNESKKTSLRVKAGQMVSFQNAIPYGNGNILGYDRVGKEFVINPEQAETVRMIFELYLQGYGSRKIADELERRRRKTATGLTTWNPQTVMRVLRNPFYCGTIVYRKEYVPDYLEQKKVKNHGEVEQVVVEGKHEPIVSKEVFEKADKIRQANQNTTSGGVQRGHRQVSTLWTKKLICQCGHHFNRLNWDGHKNGKKQYAYQCYFQRRNGTVANRKKKGLSIEGMCAVPMVPEWKLQVMSRLVFNTIWSDKKSVLRIAEDLLEKSMEPEPDEDFNIQISEIKAKIADIKHREDKLLELRLDGEITKEMFQEKTRDYDAQISGYAEELARVTSLSNYHHDNIEDKVNALKDSLSRDFDFVNNAVPESVIESFVDEIVVHDDNSFSWKLNIAEGAVQCEVTCPNKDAHVQSTISKEISPIKENSSTKGCEFSGTVPNLPKLPEGMTEKEYSNYNYKWKLISYEAMVNGAKVPVVGYYTKYDNRSVIPPSAPVDAQIESVTSNSITLTWNGGNREADHYNVYQVTGNGSNKKYEKLQKLTASGQKDEVYSFTHSDLKQDVEYSYAVAAFNADESARSVYSDVLTARTLVPEFNVKVKVSGMDSAQTYLAGTELELMADLETGNYPQSQISQYFWQVNKGKGWKTLSVGDEEGYTLRALAEMNGYKYRCNAYVSVDGRLYQLVSEEIELHVRKAEVSLSIRANKQEGAADSSSEFGLAESDADVLELTALVTSDDLKEISGQVVFHITDDVSRTAGKEYSAELSSEGVARKKCKIQKEGHYTIRANYVESETVANADSGNTLPYFAYNASQKKDREAGKQMEQEIYEKEWDDLDLKNVLERKDEITGLNEKFSQFEQQEFVESTAKNKLKGAADLLEAAEVWEVVNSFSGLTVANVASKKEEIRKAREAYDQLSDEQKELLKEENVEEKLKAAEALAASAEASSKPNTQKPNTSKPAAKKPNKTAAPNPNQKQIADISKKLGVSAGTAGKIKQYADKYGIDMDTILLTEQDIAGVKTDQDVKGSLYGKLQAKASKVSAAQIKLTWKKAKEADGYRIYQAECGKKKGYKLIKDIKKNSTKNYTVKKLKKGKGYRFLICAYKMMDGKSFMVSAAKMVHAFTIGGKKGNVSKVEVSKKKIKLKLKKKYKLKSSVKMTMKKGVKCRGICYESSDTKVASVSSKGKITAKGKGKCRIYVYAHNGVCTPVVIQVK